MRIHMKCRRTALPVLTLLALLATGGCMTDGKNDPLPVKSQQKTEYEVRALIDLLAEEIGSEVDAKSVDKEFRDCIGKNNETANDGRFDLDYTVQTLLPRAQYNTALGKLKKRLEAEGYKVSAYREGDWRHILLYAKGGDANFFVSVGAMKPPYDRMILSVTTPCFLPPGTKQEEVSAPLPRPQRESVPVAAPAVAEAQAQERPVVQRPAGPGDFG
ncbi:hypothetical protein [Streptomyces flavidovirens]|uniref:hypothetical protein n=1 Tax=Streptomyces flavidovirens TaxID=67298 RepID=UPI0004264943|nr:hypothetical protein [Streptomyces flavidovirens]